MENFDTYLLKKEQNTIKREDFVEQYPEFFRTLGNESQYNNVKVYENNTLTVEFNFNEVSIEDFKWSDHEQLEEILEKNEINLSDYWKMDQFKMKNQSNEYDFEIENSPLVIYRKEPVKDQMSGQAHIEFNFIKLDLAPSTPAGIAILLHELGHLHDDKLQAENNRQFDLMVEQAISGSEDARFDKEKDAMILRQERTAWAYGLNKLRPFIIDLNIPEDALEKYIHDYALGSYCKTMSKSY